MSDVTQIDPWPPTRDSEAPEFVVVNQWHPAWIMGLAFGYEFDRSESEDLAVKYVRDDLSHPTPAPAPASVVEALDQAKKAIQDGLTFGQLRDANMRRLPLFTNAKGGKAHEKADGSDWSPNDWMVAVVGEVGELANIMKKVRRGDFDMADVYDKISDELADIQIYLDLLADQLGVDLGEATRAKFNSKSAQLGLPVRL